MSKSKPEFPSGVAFARDFFSKNPKGSWQELMTAAVNAGVKLTEGTAKYYVSTERKKAGAGGADAPPSPPVPAVVAAAAATARVPETEAGEASRFIQAVESLRGLLVKSDPSSLLELFEMVNDLTVTCGGMTNVRRLVRAMS